MSPGRESRASHHDEFALSRPWLHPEPLDHPRGQSRRCGRFNARPVDELQFVVEPCLPRGLALDLAAGRFRQAARGDQRETGDRKFVPGRDRRADRALHCGAIRARRDFCGDTEPFTGRGWNRERRDARRAYGRVRQFNRTLDVVRVVIAAADNDEVLTAAGDKEIVPGAEVRDRRYEATPARRCS